MGSVFDLLQERGFVRQCTDEPELRRRLESGSLTYYTGFDPTASSLHIGSLMPIMAMAHLQRAGHHPIAIIGGGTTMVGDPSGKTEMRQLLSKEEIEANGVGILAQLKRYLRLDEGQGLFLNNADWLLQLNYIEFLRDIGKYFRVNEMIKMEAYRQRIEREEGLSFIEFNYQLLQAYDFWVLSQKHNCTLQMGGDDQWGNIVAGIDLIRRTSGKPAFGLTFPLLTTARGEKMGKTAQGAVWLDPVRTKPYEFYQYWINVDDADVARFLAYFTFLPMEEVNRLASLKGAEIRQAKEVLAFEATQLTHGTAAAEEARTASRAAFGGGGTDLSAIPSSALDPQRLEEGIQFVDLLREVGFCSSRGEARRLIQQGGAYLNGEPVQDSELVVKPEHVADGALMLRYGKKRYYRLIVSE